MKTMDELKAALETIYNETEAERDEVSTVRQALHVFQHGWTRAKEVLRESGLITREVAPFVAEVSTELLQRCFFGHSSVGADFWRTTEDEDNETCAPAEADYLELCAEDVSFVLVNQGYDTQAAEQLGADIMSDIADLCGLSGLSFDYDRDGEYEFRTVYFK